MIDLAALLPLLLTASTPILLAALGEMMVERAGVLNLGVEGMMIAGALGGFAAAHATGSASLGFLGGAAAGMALAVIFAVLTQHFLTNHVASGLALTLFGLGLSAMLGRSYEGVKAPALGLNWLPYAALLMVPLLALWLNRTRAGLILRAAGENAEAAHGLGHPVLLARWGAILFGGAMAGVAGAYIALARVSQWTEGMTAGAGWIALAIVVFGGWRPLGVLAGAWLFGGVAVLQLVMQARGSAIPTQVLTAAPYIATIVALALISGLQKRGGGAGGAPASLGRIFHPGR